MSKKIGKEIKATGWFGIPGGNRGTQVHCVDEQRKPVCGARIHPNGQFQWCSQGIQYSYVECRKCKEIAGRHLEEFAESRLLKYRGLP